MGASDVSSLCIAWTVAWQCGGFAEHLQSQRQRAYCAYSIGQLQAAKRQAVRMIDARLSLHAMLAHLSRAFGARAACMSLRQLLCAGVCKRIYSTALVGENLALADCACVGAA